MNLQKKQKANWAKKFTEIVAAASTTATGQKIWIIIVKFYFKLESLRKEFVFFYLRSILFSQTWLRIKSKDFTFYTHCDTKWQLL